MESREMGAWNPSLPETEVMDKNANVNGQAKDGEEIPGVGENPQQWMKQRKSQELRTQRKPQE